MATIAAARQPENHATTGLKTSSRRQKPALAARSTTTAPPPTPKISRHTCPIRELQLDPLNW
jgi:hypothetical protein